MIALQRPAIGPLVAEDRSRGGVQTGRHRTRACLHLAHETVRHGKEQRGTATYRPHVKTQVDRPNRHPLGPGTALQRLITQRRRWGMSGACSRGQQGTTAVPSGQLCSRPDQRRRFGAAAYARACRYGMQGVRGSNPLSSTRHNASPIPALSVICQQSASNRPGAVASALCVTRAVGRGRPPRSPGRRPGASLPRLGPGRPSPGWCAGSERRWQCLDAARTDRWHDAP